MREENTFAGAGLATTFLVNGLITSLVEKGTTPYRDIGSVPYRLAARGGID
jgi:hypothetical protein